MPLAARHCTLSDYLAIRGSQLRWDITGVDMHVRGRRTGGEWVYATVRIHGCAHLPFAGPHYVEVVSAPSEPSLQTPFWVRSLTCLKRKFLGFEDKFSFERSAYLALEGDKMFAVSDIRPYLVLQPRPIQSSEPIYLSPTKTQLPRRPKRTSASPLLTAAAAAPPSLQRSRKLLRRTIQRLVASYHRDMTTPEHGEPFIEDVCQQVWMDVQTELATFQQQVENHDG